jgi:hypothetical protein
MSLAGVKKKAKKCYQIWFWRLLAFVTEFGIVLAINRMCSAHLFCFQNKALKIVCVLLCLFFTFLFKLFIMVKICCYGLCKSNSKKEPTIEFLPFPKPKTNPERAKRLKIEDDQMSFRSLTASPLSNPISKKTNKTPIKYGDCCYYYEYGYGFGYG